MQKLEISSYRLTDLPPTTPADATLTIGASAGSLQQFDIPMNNVQALNLSKCLYEADLSIALLDTKYIWLYCNTVPFFSRAVMSSRTSVQLLDVQELNYAADMLHPFLMTVEDFLNIASYSELKGNYTGIQPHKDVSPWVAGPVTRANGTASTVVGPCDIVPLIVSPVGNAGGGTGALTTRISIKLSKLLPATICAKDRDIVCNDTWVLQLYTAARTACEFTGDSATNPSTAPVAPVSSVALTNCRLRLARQQNEVLNRQTQQDYNNGVSFNIDWLVVEKRTSAASNNQIFSKRYIAGQGRKIKYILHSLYTTAGATNAVYARNNYAGALCQYYNLLMGGVRTTDSTVYIVNNSNYQFDDFNIHRDDLEDKVLGSSMDLFYNNYTIIQNYCGKYANSNELGLGLELKGDIEYNLNAYAGTSAAYDHYNICCFERVVSLSPNSITCN